jgi:hypothetical protein
MPEGYEFGDREEWLTIEFAAWMHFLKARVPVPEWPGEIRN